MKPVRYYDTRAVAKLALGAGLVAGLVAYLVNGHDAIRAVLAALYWLAMGWYGGKEIFPRRSAGKT